jgi:hypothetical protein
MKMDRLGKVVTLTVLLIPLFALKAHAQNDLLENYCFECHNIEDYSGGLALDILAHDDLLTNAEQWEKVIVKLRSGMMPPPSKSSPSPSERQEFIEDLSNKLDTLWSRSPRAGAPDLHRMNRKEYQNAILDLLDLPIQAADYFPSDSVSEGFDNIAAALTVSPTLMQAYVTAATTISQLAVGDINAGTSTTIYRSASGSQASQLDENPIGTRGGISTTHFFPLDGNYDFTIGRTGSNAAFSLSPVGVTDPIELVIDGLRVAYFDPDEALKTRLQVSAGPHSIQISFVKTQNPRGVDDLYSVWADTNSIRSVTINGPYSPVSLGDTPSRQKIFTCIPHESENESVCAKSILTNLATRAFGNHVNEGSLETLMNFYKNGYELGGFEKGIQYGLARILIDPQFIYRFEQQSENSEKIGPLSSTEVASRLAFFLWSSIPDDSLLSAAIDDTLLEPATLTKQVSRMLADPKAEALIDNFAMGWLGVNQLQNFNPTDEAFDNSLRKSMLKETKLLLKDILLGNKPLIHLITADYTYVNERLAQHYSIPNIRGSHFRRIPIKQHRNSGILGHGSILSLTSAPNRTSPVLRGKWILENILGSAPPPPPAGVEVNLTESTPERSNGEGSIRIQLEKHRSDPSCASCHDIIDPLGFALENYDPVGRLRALSNGMPVDTKSTLWDGTQILNSSELIDALVIREELFAENFVRKLLTYALGRKVEYYDMPSVRNIIKNSAKDDYRFNSVILGIVESLPFLHRGPDTLNAVTSSKIEEYNIPNKSEISRVLR